MFIPDPVTAYRIPSYGGGIYCGANSDINFAGCAISGNVAPRPDATYHTDPYLGHGGGIAFEDTASIRFQNCTISDNNSAVGGGMFWSGGGPEVLDCEYRVTLRTSEAVFMQWKAKAKSVAARCTITLPAHRPMMLM